MPIPTPRQAKSRHLKALAIILPILVLLLAAAFVLLSILGNPNRYTLELDLVGEEELTLEYGTPYQDAGASVRFTGPIPHLDRLSIPVDVQGQVDAQTLGTYTLTYRVRYQPPFPGSTPPMECDLQRTVHVVDTQPPVITLTSDPAHYTIVGEPYREEGFTASDGYDGDLTDKVRRTEADGIVTYTVTDSSGNTASVQRKVVYRNPTGKVIYLTFDDGPGPHTARLLDVLAKYNVKATFFVCGTDYLASTLPRIAAEGHTVAIHTNTHDYYKIYASEEAYFEDFNAIRDQIIAYTGQAPTMLRFPGGSSNHVSFFNPGIMTTLARRVQEMGYRYYDWNVSSQDAGGLTSTTYAEQVDEVFRNVISGIGNRRSCVVLQHDSYGCSVDAVESIIQWGIANGYTFLPLTGSSPTCHQKIAN